MDLDIVAYLKTLIEEDADRKRDHLAWLQSPEAVDEQDREQQVAESERAVELAKKAQIARG